jgi:hypothetical protein
VSGNVTPQQIGPLRFIGMVLREALRHSLDIAQSVIFVVLIVAGTVAIFYPGARDVLRSINLDGWQAALVVLGIVVTRVVCAPYWLFKSSQTRLIELFDQLATIGAKRDLSFVTMEITCSNVGRLFNISRLGIRFENTGSDMLSYNVDSLIFDFAGYHIDFKPNGAAGYVSANQPMNYAGDLSTPAVVDTFPVTIRVSFKIRYNNVRPTVERATDQVVEYVCQSFNPLVSTCRIISRSEL